MGLFPFARGGLVRFRHGRVGMDGAKDLVQPDAVFHGQDVFRQQVAGIAVDVGGEVIDADHPGRQNARFDLGRGLGPEREDSVGVGVELIRELSDRGVRPRILPDSSSWPAPRQAPPRRLPRSACHGDGLDAGLAPRLQGAEVEARGHALHVDHELEDLRPEDRDAAGVADLLPLKIKKVIW